MKESLKAILLGASFLPFTVFSAVDSTIAVVPEKLHIYDSAGNTFVDLVAKGCSGKRYWLDPHHPKYDSIVSILLSSQIAKKKVVVRFEGCTGQAQGKIIGIYLSE